MQPIYGIGIKFTYFTSTDREYIRMIAQWLFFSLIPFTMDFLENTNTKNYQSTKKKGSKAPNWVKKIHGHELKISLNWKQIANECDARLKWTNLINCRTLLPPI